MGGAGNTVLLFAEQAGHLQPHPLPQHLHAQRRMPAGAGQQGRGGSQLKYIPRDDDRLTAGRADIGQGTANFLQH
ncbi:hypothetical protein SDC9_121310 [bioreactor metagenome]|uniref:Uncharacterized protein n=1 Tax=bioreactor metagenome TaxID=1076179 RepID=A0A645CBL3_9ZZZZ